METAISVTGLPPKSVTAFQKAVEGVLRVGFQTHADQETIRAALDTLGRGMTTNISHCQFTGK